MTKHKEKRKREQEAPQTTAGQLASIIKSCRDIMRKDKGLNGDLDRLPMLTWVMFLKFLDDLEDVRKEEAELAILESYMPPQLDRSQIIKLIDEAMAESGASTKRDAGKVMKLVMEKAKGRADGKSINALVMERLK